MPFELPPIVKLAERLLVDIELAVAGFPRRHKYVVGVELRQQMMAVARLTHRAWRDSARKPEWTSRLVFAVDDLKLTMQLAKRVEAFRSFKEFEALIRLIADLGRQCGGWQKQQHQSGQNARTHQPSGRRTQTLSSRGASQEATS